MNKKERKERKERIEYLESVIHFCVINLDKHRNEFEELTGKLS